ncbi:hypothetical protein [Acetonema longum]|uniref:Uncharacterized protein n=1 Tax=Acetonema longum DSM 6540 TaxID=1009370 RepID=F7NK82_9FIRM|nr:hypothetical protein [Acetonema longum]EGO63523.1 hypothetical protein ALO_12476 [Acetonema longum DSM 6540]
MDLVKTEREFGSVEFEGKKYILTSQADLTGRLIQHNGYNDPDDNGDYDFEMSASAVDECGDEYTVYWIFNTRKDADGVDKELDQYDYDEVDRVVERY